jgi:hypothetical protein
VYSQYLSHKVGKGEVTSKEALAEIANLAGLLAGDPKTFVDLLGRVLSHTSMQRPGRPAGDPRTIPRFTSSGFRPQYQDDSNQVRHWAGAFVVGAAWGAYSGMMLNGLREIYNAIPLVGGGGFSLADIRLGEAAAILGDRVVAGNLPPLHVPTIIRTQF